MNASSAKHPLSEDSLFQINGGSAISGYIEHTVKRGDTLEQIAERYHVTVAQLMELNNIRNRSLLFMGDIIRVPVRIRC